MKNIHKGFLLVALLLVLSSCATLQSRMSALASTTGSVTLRVERLCARNLMPDGATNKSILLKATEGTPYERGDFEDYTFNAKCVSAHAVVLICSKDGAKALIEETACVMGPDKNHWEAKPPVPCDFTIDERYINEKCK